MIFATIETSEKDHFHSSEDTATKSALTGSTCTGLQRRTGGSWDREFAVPALPSRMRLYPVAVAGSVGTLCGLGLVVSGVWKSRFGTAKSITNHNLATFRCFDSNPDKCGESKALYKNRGSQLQVPVRLRSLCSLRSGQAFDSVWRKKTRQTTRRMTALFSEFKTQDTSITTLSIDIMI